MKGIAPSPTSRRKFVVYTVSLLTALAVNQNLLGAEDVPATVPRHHVPGGFRNLSADYSYPFVQRARGLLHRRRGPMERLATLANDGSELRRNGHLATVTWVGHSTFLIQVDGLNILTDPHWGNMASPVRFAGPRRIAAPGIHFEDLPPIDVVVISHDHYDHLDEGTVRRLARVHHPRFFVPLGLKNWLEARGVDEVVELDWWQRARFRGLTVTCTPAQHSSGRGLDDQNRRLWSSWVIAGADKRVFFAGDTGYYRGLKEIGDRLGPFDLALIPIGGYSDFRRHHPNHVNPEEAVQVFEDVRGELMVPMHWGTFDFNQEPAGEPPDRLMREALARGIEERIAILSPGQTLHW
jgi:N-acyl-phosphatidylethanolamine-hydrolysing phospholipase D